MTELVVGVSRGQLELSDQPERERKRRGEEGGGRGRGGVRLGGSRVRGGVRSCQIKGGVYLPVNFGDEEGDGKIFLHSLTDQPFCRQHHALACVHR